MPNIGFSNTIAYINRGNSIKDWLIITLKNN